MPFGPASLLGVERFSEESEAPLELIPGDEDARKEQIIRAVYKQVLGNAYVMDSERQIVEESQFKLGEISVRELVGRIAKSDLYRSRFFDNCARYRYIELAFRHLLGRAPADYAEMREHADRLDSQGYEADIDSFLNSAEYQNTFGEWTVPYQRGWKTESCATLQEFTWSFQLLRGNSSSSLKGDLAGNRSKLGGSAYLNRAIAVVPPSSKEDRWLEFPSLDQPSGRTHTSRGWRRRSRHHVSGRGHGLQSQQCQADFPLHPKQPHLLRAVRQALRAVQTHS